MITYLLTCPQLPSKFSWLLGPSTSNIRHYSPNFLRHCS